MRTRTVVVLALLTLPVELIGQGIRPPRTGRGALPQPAPLPPEAPAVSRALAYRRSRWSTEAYSMLTTVQVPAANENASYNSFGTGTHADYRFSDHISGTVDMTASFLGSSAVSQTAEIGARYRALPWHPDLRPFFDLRVGYTHMHDTYAGPSATNIPGGPGVQVYELSRYSYGLGSLAGAGFEYSLTTTLALTTELSAMRNRMRTYRLTGGPEVGDRGTYWMTAYRYTIGLKYNAARVLNLKQNPTS